jgi:uncharacterized membrane protein
MRLRRVIRHLFSTHGGTRRHFSAEVMGSIEKAIAAAEARCSGEIRFVVETALELPEVWSGLTPRERAVQTFSDLHMWNTEGRNGVLIYLLAADRVVEVIADRGAAQAIGQDDWEGVCRLMEGHFRVGHFADGSVAGVHAVGGLLARHFPPPAGVNRDELPNQPTLL